MSVAAGEGGAVAAAATVAADNAAAAHNFLTSPSLYINFTPPLTALCATEEEAMSPRSVATDGV